jgi:hypothetical protein
VGDGQIFRRKAFGGWDETREREEVRKLMFIFQVIKFS